MAAFAVMLGAKAGSGFDEMELKNGEEFGDGVALGTPLGDTGV